MGPGFGPLFFLLGLDEVDSMGHKLSMSGFQIRGPY